MIELRTLKGLKNNNKKECGSVSLHEKMPLYLVCQVDPRATNHGKTVTHARLSVRWGSSSSAKTWRPGKYPPYAPQREENYFWIYSKLDNMKFHVWVFLFVVGFICLWLLFFKNFISFVYMHIILAITVEKVWCFMA